MYHEIKRLREVDRRSIQWIADHLKLNFRTVKKLLDMEPDAFQEYLKTNEKRSCVLDPYRDFVESRLQLFPETSSAQMLDWLKENYLDLPVVHPKTAYNFVMRIRQDYGIPKVAICSRQYAAVPELPPGEQAQVDFGQIKLRTSTDTRKTIHFFSMLLCHSRMKFLIARETPFTAQSAVEAHEKAFEYFQGMPRQIVYDQDSVFLSKENLGDLIMTDIFNRYQAGRPFKVLFCRAADPESKGKIENVVKFIKQNFLYNRQYVDEVTINSQAIDWLKRTGNGMRHNTTCKIPYEEWLAEREHLLAWNPLMRIEQTEYHKVIKTNTVRFKGNTYSLPLGTYKNENSRVFLKESDGRLLIHDENGLLVAMHTIPDGRGRTVINNHHRRDMSVGLNDLRSRVRAFFGGSNQVQAFITELEKKYPRYVRDQLSTLLQCSELSGRLRAEKALHFCLDNRLFSVNDFKKILELDTPRVESTPDIRPLGDTKTYLMANMRPEKSDINDYERLFQNNDNRHERAYNPN
jgi:transposase